jgi:hypothetical protein
MSRVLLAILSGLAIFGLFILMIGIFVALILGLGLLGGTITILFLICLGIGFGSVYL